LVYAINAFAVKLNPLVMIFLSTNGKWRNRFWTGDGFLNAVWLQQCALSILWLSNEETYDFEVIQKTIEGINRLAHVGHLHSAHDDADRLRLQL
jgi:hypothetical protein